jgi:hypothetical protein
MDVFLAHPSQEHPYLLETDASKYTWGAILSQQQEDGTWRPVSCLSKGFTDVETRYDVHDRELLAIIRSLESLRHFLMGTKHPVTVLTDNKNLNYFRTKQFPTDRQTRWIDFLSKFDLQIRYHPGKQSKVPDLLSRRADHIPEEDLVEEPQVLLPPSMFPSEIIATLDTPDLQSLLYTSQAKDPLLLGFNMQKQSDPVPLGWSKEEDLWCYRSKIYLPESVREAFFHALHSSPTAAHPGRQATLFSIRGNYYWPGEPSLMRPRSGGPESRRRLRIPPMLIPRANVVPTT